MRRTQSSDSRPTVPGARIRALPAAVRPPAPLRGRRPAQALGPCRQGARVSAVTAPGSGRPPRSWSPAASPTHRGPSCDRAHGSRNGGTPTPTWAPQGAIQCRIAVIAMSRGQTPRRRHVGPHRTGWGLSQVERRGGCRAGPLGSKRRPGETPGMHDAAKPWRVALQRGRRGSPRPCGPPRRWQARRAETGLAATVGQRHAAAAAWDGKRKGVTGQSRSTAAAPPVSRSEAMDRPSQLSYPTPAPAA